MAYVWIVVFFFTLATQSEQGVLPHPKKKVNPNIIRVMNEAPLKTHNHPHEFANHENIMIRKAKYGHFEKLAAWLNREFDVLGKIFLSQPKTDGDRKVNTLMNKLVKYKTEDEKKDTLRSRLNNLFTSEEIRELQNIDRENTMLRKSKYGHLGKSPVLPDKKYDERGRIVLSQPKNDEDRKINTLINKVIKYKSEDEKKDFLRSGIYDLFTSDEMKQLQNIARATGVDYKRINSEDKTTRIPIGVYRFSDLVV